MLSFLGGLLLVVTLAAVLYMLHVIESGIELPEHAEQRQLIESVRASCMVEDDYAAVMQARDER